MKQFLNSVEWQWLLRMIALLLAFFAIVLTGGSIVSSRGISDFIVVYNRWIMYSLNLGLLWYPFEQGLLWFRSRWLLRSASLFSEDMSKYKEKFQEYYDLYCLEGSERFLKEIQGWLQDERGELAEQLKGIMKQEAKHSRDSSATRFRPELFAHFFMLSLERCFYQPRQYLAQVALLSSLGQGFGILGTLLFMSIALGKSGTNTTIDPAFLSYISVAVTTTASGVIVSIFGDIIQKSIYARMDELEFLATECVLGMNARYLLDSGSRLDGDTKANAVSWNSPMTQRLDSMEKSDEKAQGDTKANVVDSSDEEAV